MKTQQAINWLLRGRIGLAVLMVGWLAVSTNAQELFRVGRPDYARNPRHAGACSAQTPTLNRPSYSDATSREFQHLQPDVSYWRPEATHQPWGSSELSNGSMTDSIDSLGADTTRRPDYQRLQLAWENFQREMSRYQARYGGQEFATPWVPRGSQPDRPLRGRHVRPTGLTDARVTPAEYIDQLPAGQCNNRLCAGRSQLSPADLPPQLSRNVPVRPYRDAPALRSSDRQDIQPRREYELESARVRRPLVPLTPRVGVGRNHDRFVPDPYRTNSQEETQQRFQPNRSAGADRMFTPSTNPPANRIDPTKIASRARDFFRHHLSE